MKGLENLVKLGKKALKGARNIGYAAVASAALVSGMSEKADAGTIYMANTTSDSSIGKTIFYVKNISGATDGYDTAYDSTYMDPIQTNGLQIYTKVDGSPTGKLSTDAHPINTPGWDFFLGVKGTVSDIDNYLRYKVQDTTDLIGQTVSVYDTLAPETKHELLMDGAYHNIPLPNLTGTNVEYAHWRADIGSIPEPSSLSLLAMAGITGGVGYIASRGRRGRGRGRRKEERRIGNTA